jgi:acyl-CoA reductase-like NAD-dependent aldehyde dehydrogenase
VIITPFNNPLAIPIGKIAPAILFGNTVVWKPAPAGAAIAQSVLTLARAAGWQVNGLDLLHIVNGDSSVAAALAADSNIDAVTVSASLAAGYALQEICASRHIPFQAELGGNNPAIVWRDADLPDAAGQIAAGAFGFAGQRCTANRRAVVDAACFDAFISHLTRATAALHWGPASDLQTVVGPLLHAAKRDQVAAILSRAGATGCQILTPHQNQSNYAALMQSGPYLPPAIVICDDPAHEIVQEETFGPVLVVQRATTFDHALQLANGVRQGLVSALFSPNPGQQQQFLANAQAGVLKLNRSTVDADASSPLGGWKASACGPPEHGPSDREFFTRTQTIYG